MRHRAGRFLSGFLVFLLCMGPDLLRGVWAQGDAGGAADGEVRTLQRLARSGYLGDKADYYLSHKALSDEDVVNALIAIDANILKVDLKGLKPGDKRYQPGDLQSLLEMVQDRSEDIRAEKVSAWAFQHKLQKMIAILAPSESPDTPPAASAAPTVSAPPPSPTPTPVPGPSREELNEVKGDLRDLSKRLRELQERYEKRMDEMEMSNGQMRAANGKLREPSNLVQTLLDRVQADQKRIGDRLDEVDKKAGEKNVTDAELERDLTLMRKDLRDNTQDISVLKQQVEKLNMPDKENGTPLDQALNSKWLAGGALLVGLTALVISLTRK